MKRLVEIKVAKFNVLSILDCCYRLFPLIYISYDSEGMTIQGSCARIERFWQPPSSSEIRSKVMNVEANLWY